MVKNYQKNLKNYTRLLVYTVYSQIYDIQISALYDGGRPYMSTSDEADMKVCFQRLTLAFKYCRQSSLPLPQRKSKGNKF